MQLAVVVYRLALVSMYGSSPAALHIAARVECSCCVGETFVQGGEILNAGCTFLIDILP